MIIPIPPFSVIQFTPNLGYPTQGCSQKFSAYKSTTNAIKIHITIFIGNGPSLNFECNKPKAQAFICLTLITNYKFFFTLCLAKLKMILSCPEKTTEQVPDYITANAISISKFLNALMHLQPKKWSLKT